MKRTIIRIPRFTVICLCLGVGQASAQTAAPPASEENARTKEAPGERQHLYETYFAEMCEKKQVCDATCKKVFDGIIRQDKFKWRCP
jgi:hypothetical protein